MKKITLYKAVKNSDLIQGEKVTITDTNGCAVTEWVDFKKSGLHLVGRSNQSFWGFDRVVDAFISKGYTKL